LAKELGQKLGGGQILLGRLPPGVKKAQARAPFDLKTDGVGQNRPDMAGLAAVVKQTNRSFGKMHVCQTNHVVTSS
jgi:hypothetical protein